MSRFLKVARDLAGLIAGEDELLRRALGAKDPGPAVDRFREAFITGVADNGVDVETAEMVFNKLRALGGYSFPKSHAAAFFVVLLNNQPMGFWTPAVLINDAKRHGIPVHGVGLHRSGWHCTIEADTIRPGFNSVREMTEAQVEAIQSTRPFIDLVHQARLPRRIVEHLIQAGALDACGWGGRREPDALGLSV